MKKTLECSSKGDKRFSDLYAKIEYNGRIATIEKHYQSSKLFYNKNLTLEAKSDWRDAKGEDACSVEINGKVFDEKYLQVFYKLLWVKYLDQNPELVEYAKEYDNFKDMYKGRAINSQADIIRQYVKEGRISILQEVRVMELVSILNNHYVIGLTGDLLEAKMDIIGHQVNCLGVMGGGLALQIKKRYPEVYKTYKSYCTKNSKNIPILGRAQFISISGKELNPNSDKSSERIIANLFGQYDYGTDKVRTQPDKLLQALKEVKEFAMIHGYTIALPHQLGSGLAGGDWRTIYKMIEFVFRDYPVFIYRLN